MTIYETLMGAMVYALACIVFAGERWLTVVSFSVNIALKLHLGEVVLQQFVDEAVATTNTLKE
ncbi:hypothetical protein [Nostoc sp.]